MNGCRTVSAVIGSILLVAACSIRPVPTIEPVVAPSVSATPEEPSEAPGLPLELAAIVAETPLVVIAPDGSVLVGTLGRGWTRIDRPTNVSQAFGRILGAAPRGEQLEIWEASVDGHVEVLHTTRCCSEATTFASVTRDGDLLVLSNPTIGMRLVDLSTGDEREVVAPDGRNQFNPVEWSPSGSRGVAASCDEVTCATYVFDRASLTTASFDAFVPAAIAGTTVIGYEEVTNPAPLLLDAGTGLRTPAGGLDKLWDAVPVSEDAILAWGSTAQGSHAFVLYDLASGGEGVVALDRFTRTPVEALVDPSFAVLTADGPGLPLGGVLDVIDLITGTITSDVIPVPPAP